MRKVKVLALLLAALMVVAVFAGCADTDAIVADVENLDERVEALENLLNNQKDAIDDVKDQLGDVSDKLDNDTTAAQLEAVLKALEEQQKANAELQEQLKELGDKVTEVEKDTEDADDDAALEAAVKVYTAQLQELKITCELKKDLYIAADYEAVVKALSDGIVAVAAAEKADDAKAAFEAAKAVYDAKAIVSSKLAAYYAQVNNTITADSKALIEEIRAYINDDPATEYVCPVNQKYNPTADPAVKVDELTNAELLVDNLNGVKGADGKLVKVNVVAELKNAVAAYDHITSKEFADKVKAAVDAIAEIKTVTYNESITDASSKYDLVVADVVALDADKNGETDNKQYAPYVADSVLAQVTNAAELNAAKARLVELTVAAAMYDTYVALSTGTVGEIFDAYTDLSATDKVLYTNKPVYDAVDAILNKWVDAYKLEAENVEAIVNAKEGADFYYGYLKNKLTTELSVKAYADFAAIANRIAALNKLTTVTAANVTEYGEITKAITAWQKLQTASTATDATRLEKETITLSPENVTKIIAAYELPGAVDAASFNYALYKFADENVNKFFKEKYATIATQAETLNDKIASLKSNLAGSIKYSTIEEFLKVKGEYVKSGDVWVKNTTPSGTDTIVGFLETYKDYDLASLIDTDVFDAALAQQIARIDGFKAGAANIKTLVEAIDYTAVIKNSDISYATPTKEQVENRQYYCYVNLSDAEAVAKANAAYGAWIKDGGNTNLKEWIPALNEKGEVIKDTYVFAPIADKVTIDQLTQMVRDIDVLKDVAAKVVAHFKLVAEIWNENSAFALNAGDANTSGTDVLTLVPAYLDAGITNKVPYVQLVALSEASGYTFSFNGETIKLAAKTSVVATEKLLADDAPVVTTLQALIDVGYKAYQAFLTMNAELTFKTSNGKVVLDKFSRVNDASVTAALDSIAAAELVMLKDYAKDEIMKSSMVDTDKKTFCGYVDTLVTSVSGNGSQLHNIALELSARFQLDLAALNRGDKVEVTIVDEVKTGVGDAGVNTKHVQDYTQVFRVAADNYGNLDK